MAIDKDHISPSQEKAICKAGYFWAFANERHPVNGDIGNCSSKESAYFWTLEEEAMNIPQDLTFRALEQDIHPDHRERMRNMWEVVLKYQERYINLSNTVKGHWSNAPKIKDEAADETLEWVSFRFGKKLLRAAKATIGWSDATTDSVSKKEREVAMWQTTNFALRTAIYDTDKNYLAAQRVFFGLLFENVGDLPPVFPPDHAKRAKIEKRIATLRLVDSTHQGLSIGKAHPHRKADGSQLRDTKKKPFIHHPEEVALADIFDTWPHIEDEINSVITPEELGLIGALHDIEDTRRTIKQILIFAVGHVDRYDSILQDVLISGSTGETEEVAVERLQQTILNLLREETASKIAHILFAVTEDSEKVMSDDMKEKAVRQNLLGRTATFSHIGLDENEARESCARWGVSYDELSKDPKPGMGKKILEMKKISKVKIEGFWFRERLLDPQERAKALRVKCEDRRSNMQDANDVKKFPSRKRGLRETVQILIPECLEPEVSGLMYNALPNLIDITLIKYEELISQFPGFVDQCDHDNVEQLKAWKVNVVRHEISGRAKEAIERWEAARKPKGLRARLSSLFSSFLSPSSPIFTSILTIFTSS